MTIDCTLLCASGAAYNINQQTGLYTADPVFSKAVNYSADPVPISSAGKLNACLVGKNADGILVAFRGTLPPGEPKSLPDWIQDFLAIQVNGENLPGKVHLGFVEALDTIIADVIAAVNNLDPANNAVYVTGHSKGGGLAPLAAWLLNHAGIKVKQVITFAAPKPGDVAFKTAYEAAFPNHVRYENFGDLVPLLPPSPDLPELIAPLISRIRDVGPEIAQRLQRAAEWEFRPVGTELYIESAKNKFALKTNEPVADQTGDFFGYLFAHLFGIFPALGDAHTLKCGFGYMSGTCPPEVCAGH